MSCLLAHLHNHWSELVGTRRCVFTSCKPGPMPGLQVQHIHVHVPIRVNIVRVIHQHIRPLSHNTHATAELWGWQAPSGLPVLPLLLYGVKTPQCLVRLHPVLCPSVSEVTCAQASSNHDGRVTCIDKVLNQVNLILLQARCFIFSGYPVDADGLQASGRSLPPN